MAAVLDRETLSNGRVIRVGRGSSKLESTVVPFEPTRSTSMESQAHFYLELWGRAVRNGINLGYPARWVTGKAGEGGITAGSPRPPTALSDDNALSDRAIASLDSRHHSILGRFLHWRYEDGITLEKISKLIGENRSAVKKLEARAQRSFWLVRQSLTP